MATTRGPKDQPVPEEPKKDRFVPGPVGVDLQTAVSSLVLSILKARQALDAETARIAEHYQSDEVLRQFTVPAFGISEVTLRLPYAAIELQPNRPVDLKPEQPGDLPRMQVHISADVIARLPAHAVGQVELKLSQELLSLMFDEQQPG